MGRPPKTMQSQRGTERAEVPTNSSAHQPMEPRVGATRVPSATGPATSAVRLLRFPALRERIGLSRSTIWRLERRGEFPKHRRISANAVAWIDEEVMTWIRSRK